MIVLIIIVDQVINKTGMVDTSEEGFQRVLDNTDVIVFVSTFLTSRFSSVQVVPLIAKKMKRIYKQC